MTQKLKHEQEQAVRAVYGFAANLMRQGESNYQIEKKLVEQGLAQDVARAIVRNLSDERNRQMSQAHRDAALKNMAIGGVVCVIGLIITIGSYSAASSSATGGSYVVAWGAVLFGGFQFLKGLFQMMQ